MTLASGNKETRAALIAALILIASCARGVPPPPDARIEEARRSQDPDQAVLLFRQKQDWQNHYYRRDADGKYLTGHNCQGGPCYNVIVATANSAEEANQLLDRLNPAYPMAFQLWTTQSTRRPYAVVAAIGLPQQEAIELAHRINADHRDFDARGWRWPKFVPEREANLAFF